MVLKYMQTHLVWDSTPGKQQAGRQSHILGVGEVPGSGVSAGQTTKARQWHSLLSEASPYTKPKISEVGCPALVIN